MKVEFFLALRHLRSRRRQRLARATTGIALLGIASGVASLIVALAIADGFHDEMRDKILRGTAHITVTRADGSSMLNYRDVAAKIGTLKGVVNATGSTYDGAVIVGPKNSAYSVMRGVEPSASAEISKTIVRGTIAPLFVVSTDEQALPSVVLGSELASRIGVDVGDVAEVIPAQAGTSNSNVNRRRVRVSGIFSSGLFEYDATWIYLSLETVAAFTAGNHAASVISVQLADIYDVKRVEQEITAALGSDYAVIDWQEANRPLFTALAVERRISIVIIALIVFIAALNITTTLILLVMERRRDIAILNAMGATSNSIMKVFVIEGALLGLSGAVLGVLLGVAAVSAGNRYHLIKLPPDVYSISQVPLHLSFNAVIFAALIAFVLSVIATIYPARAASRLRPAELLRNL